ncbi:MAG: 6,7-dimethyl-8-ribityllumazine synthase [Actinomycetaceae bacterium]|nr:6,7-dimethyl-8-ribityllumazine synthase [Arcanobacterium sp.]MDD7505064.1 6,7-dimethyl-8-ribityllumazine synthase [Actinomycetaceae bacterium]MDY6143755.1 6,7-dimethyl-8-ribityllumazine synthase [Arcanobacterium sp.]
MAIGGQPAASPITVTNGAAKRIAIVASSWYSEIMDGLIAGAQRACASAGVQTELMRVPGSFEIPLACRWALDAGADAAIALGVVIRGETPHFDYVCEAATDGVNRVTLATGKPIGFGILTCETEEQARERAGLLGSNEDKGYEAAHAALTMLYLQEGLNI